MPTRLVEQEHIFSTQSWFEKHIFLMYFLISKCNRDAEVMKGGWDWDTISTFLRFLMTWNK